MADKAARLTFHLPPDAGPDDTLALLATLHRYPDRFSNRRDLSAIAMREYGAGGHYQDADTVALLTSLLEVTPTRPTLTELGGQIVITAPDLQPDLLHYLLYTAWQATEPTLNTVAWSYHTICNLLWQQGEGEINLNRLVRDTMLAREDQFAAIAAYRSQPISFSAKSVRGAIVWLEQLNPPAVREREFTRRYTCPPALLLLALGWAARDTVATSDDPDRLDSLELPLHSERRTTIAQLCLLDPAQLDRLLDELLDRYPQFVSEGTQAGTYGRFIRLRRLPRPTDPAFWEIVH